VVVPTVAGDGRGAVIWAVPGLNECEEIEFAGLADKSEGDVGDGRQGSGVPEEETGCGGVVVVNFRFLSGAFVRSDTAVEMGWRYGW
jgi:hypothetical protein